MFIFFALSWAHDLVVSHARMFFCRKVSMKEISLLWRICPFPSYLSYISSSTTNELKSNVGGLQFSTFLLGFTPSCGILLDSYKVNGEQVAFPVSWIEKSKTHRKTIRNSKWGADNVWGLRKKGQSANWNVTREGEQNGGRSMRVEKCVIWWGLHKVFVRSSLLGDDFRFDKSCIFQLEWWLAKLFVTGKTEYERYIKQFTHSSQIVQAKVDHQNISPTNMENCGILLALDVFYGDFLTFYLRKSTFEITIPLNGEQWKRDGCCTGGYHRPLRISINQPVSWNGIRAFFAAHAAYISCHLECKRGNFVFKSPATLSATMYACQFVSGLIVCMCVMHL